MLSYLGLDGLGLPGDTAVVEESPVSGAIFVRPELLTHPPLPAPMHGTNPRTVLGKEWWDEHRKAAYAVNRQHCWACGTHKTNTGGRPVLEAHEAYTIHWATGRVELDEIVALCGWCRKFIHRQRLEHLLNSEQITPGQYENVHLHGQRILRRAGMRPHWITENLWLDYCGLPLREAEGMTAMATWEKWCLVIDGVEHPTVLKNYEDWKATYQT